MRVLGEHEHSQCHPLPPLTHFETKSADHPMQTYPSTAFSHMQARRCILAMMKHQPSQTFVPFQRRCPVLLLGEKQQTHPQSRRRPVHLCTPRRHAQERRGERRRPTSAPESPPRFPLPAAGACGRTGAFLPNPSLFFHRCYARV